MVHEEEEDEGRERLFSKKYQTLSHSRFVHGNEYVAVTKNHIALPAILISILAINMADITWTILVTATHFFPCTDEAYLPKVIKIEKNYDCSLVVSL